VRRSASVVGRALPISRPPRAPRAGAVVVSCGNPATAALDLIQRSRVGHAVRAGQPGADSSSTVQSRFDRAGPVSAPAGLDRTRVGRMIWKAFLRQLREQTCRLAAMQARYRLDEGRMSNGRCILR